jgi:low affinity Fe/Cu permease
MSRKVGGLNEHFLDLARKSSEIVGAPWFFLIAVCAIIGWAVVGFFFRYSDWWHLILNTLIAIMTFLIVVLLQSAQNRELKAFQLKLDELIKSNKRARDGLINLQELSEEELESLRKGFERVQKDGATGSKQEMEMSVTQRITYAENTEKHL